MQKKSILAKTRIITFKISFCKGTFECVRENKSRYSLRQKTMPLELLREGRGSKSHNTY